MPSFVSLKVYVYLLVLHIMPGVAMAQVVMDTTQTIQALRTVVDDLTTGPTDRSKPFSRSAQRDREWAALYIRDLWSAEGLDAQLHRYKWPNKNGLLDLLFPPYKGINVHAMVPATTPSDEVVILGAHYDSEPDSPGAGDNAAGVALVIHTARIVQQWDVRTMNYLFVLFDQEEDDGVGSKAFVKLAEQIEYGIHAAHITDLIGWDREGDGEIEIQTGHEGLQQSYADAARMLNIPLRFTDGASSDRVAFFEAGHASVGVFGDITEHYHKSTDQTETVDFNYLYKANRLILAVLGDANE